MHYRCPAGPSPCGVLFSLPPFFKPMQSLWMLAAAFLFALMAACTKLGASDFGTFELVFYRSLFGVAVIAAWTMLTGRTLKTSVLGSHIKRSFLGTFALTIWFFAIAHLPLGTSMTLNYTSPLYMAVILTVLALRRGSPLQPKLLAAIVLGFIGIVLVLHPEIRDGDEIPALVGLTAGLFSALAYYQVKQLSAMHEPEWRIVFYFTAFGTVWGFAGQFLLESFSPLSWRDAPALLGMGASATAAQLCMTRAWGAGNMLLSSVLQFSAIVFAALLGLLFFGEPLTLQSTIGILVIIAAGVWATLLTKRAQNSGKS